VINRTLQGLLSILDAKTRGVLPNELEDKVRLVLDSQPFYDLGAVTAFTAATVNITASGTTGSIVVVPPGEYWFPFTVSTVAINQFAGSNSIRFETYLNDNTPNEVMLSFLLGSMLAIGQANGTVWIPPFRMIWTPSTNIFGVASGVVASSLDVTVSVGYVRYRF